MPSSLMCCSEDRSFEWKHLLHKQENGVHIKQRTPENAGCENESFPSKILLNFSLLLIALQPSFIDFPPGCNSQSEFACDCFPSLCNFGCFFDLKMPGSPGSVAAHHMYNMTTHVICKKRFCYSTKNCFINDLKQKLIGSH